MNRHMLRILCVIAAMMFDGVVFAQNAPPLYADETPKQIRGLGISEKLNEMAPLDLPMKDENGKDVTLRDYLHAGKPIILTPVYFQCPMLCSETLNGLVNGLNQIEMSAGKEFTIITFSFNHKEEPKLAEVKRRAYLTQYRRESAKEGWHFLTGTEENVKALCDGIGFSFRYDEQADEYYHSATITFLTPDGRISRYINNVLFEPRDLKFALIETSQGQIGSPMDKFLLFFCFHYDPMANSYAASAVKIMRLGGLVTVVLIAAGLGFLWWRGPRPDVRGQRSEVSEKGQEAIS